MQRTPTVPPITTMRPPVQEPPVPGLEQAIKRIRDKSALKIHLVAYLVINAWFVAIWAVTETGYFFWPIFAMVGWGTGVAIHGYSIYGGDSEMTETQLSHVTPQRRRTIASLGEEGKAR